MIIYAQNHNLPKKMLKARCEFWKFTVQIDTKDQLLFLYLQQSEIKFKISHQMILNT